MINLKKNQVNEVFLELYNVTTISPAYYLIHLSNNSNQVEKLFYSANVSTNVKNYDKFLIEETASEDLSDGKISLDSGQWVYKIYQSGTSSLSLTYSTAAYNGSDYIASGYVYVESNATEKTKYSPNSDTKKIYKPN